MVFGIITAIAACPAIIGTTEAIRQGQRKSAKEQHRGAKTNLVVSCSNSEVNGCAVVLRDGRLFIATHSASGGGNLAAKRPPDHPFAGYFLPYPEQNWGRKGEGLVSTISDDPPQLNWIFVDQESHEVRYGTKLEAQGHIVGPWDCTRIDKRVTLEGWEGFMAVEEVEYQDGQNEKDGSSDGWNEEGQRKSWALYFDRDNDGLVGKIEGWRIFVIELTRKERRKGKGENGD